MKEQIRSILIIKLDAIGDFALALPALRGLVNAHPDIQLDVVVSSMNEGWRDVVPWVRNWYFIDFRGYIRPEIRRTGKVELIRRLLALTLRRRRIRYEAAFDLRAEIFEGGCGDWRGKVITWLSGAPLRVGASGAGEWALTRVCPQLSIHQSDLLLDRLRIFDAGLQKAESGVVNISRCRPKSAAPHLVLHPGAGSAAKLWPLEHWITLARDLGNHPGRVTFQLLGGPGDQSRLDEIVKAATLDPGQARISTSFRETLQILADADLLVGLDSAPVHMAYLVGTPVITIYSAVNDPARWKALGDNTVLFTQIECSPCHLPRCKWETHRCMAPITPARVLATIRQRVNLPF